MFKPFVRVVVATQEEYDKAIRRFPKYKVIQTGVGGINVYHSLKHIPRWFKIINFGYAGSNNIPLKEEVRIKQVYSYHPKVDSFNPYLEPTYVLSKKYSDKEYICYTNNDFVTETEITEPCVFDMELAYICAMGFRNVKSIKIISDNLSTHEYQKSLEEDK